MQEYLTIHRNARGRLEAAGSIPSRNQATFLDEYRIGLLQGNSLTPEAKSAIREFVRGQLVPYMQLRELDREQTKQGLVYLFEYAYGRLLRKQQKYD